MKNRYLLIDCCLGIYIPSKFYHNFDWSKWSINKDDYPSLADPDNEFYWDDWEDVLREAKYRNEKGTVYSLYHDDDLWAVEL